jgi:glycosyltransferase involved in cell wall biosynthesis
MRICNVCLTHDPDLGGLHRSVADFATALDAGIVSFDDGLRQRPRHESQPRVERVACGSLPGVRECHFVFPAAARHAAAAVADADLLVVHSLFRGHASWTRRWARRHGRRYWSVPHGCLDPWSLSQRGVSKRLWLTTAGRSFLRDAERVVFSSRRSLEKARRWVAAERGVVVPWPVEVPATGGDDESRRRFRENLGIPDGSRVLLFLGRLHSVKRPVETLRAFVAADPPRCHLVIAGMDGDVTRTQLLRMVPPAFASRVHLVGPLADGEVAAAYRGADGFISLSWQENFGYAAAEAVAYGLPVILSGGHDLAHEMPLRAGRFGCGWLLDEDAVVGAVDAIRGFAAATEADLAAMGAAGRSWAGDVLTRARFRDTLTRLAEG